MYYAGTAKLDKRTKNLVKRLKAKDIAIIDHADLDRVTAESLLETRVKVVVNASLFMTGRYPNIGPLILYSAGVHLIDGVGQEIFKKVSEGEKLVIQDGELLRDGESVGRGKVLTHQDIQDTLERGKKSLDTELERFATNTLRYIQEEKGLLLEGVELPDITTQFSRRQALIVVRGYDYKEDLQALRAYIREVKPVIVGVDGGADALMDEGYKPDLIMGDMDSVGDKTLLSGAELVVHAYPDGRAPGLSRLKNLGLSPKIFKAPGTSEDIALLLAYEKGAELIVAVGTHAHLIEFLDKGRQGMASTFLVRLKVGSRLVDAKGVSKLYRSRVRISDLVIILLAALVTVVAVIIASPLVRQLIRLIILNLRLMLGT